MSGSGGFAVSRSDTGERFCNPPAIHRRHNRLLQRQQLHRRNHHHHLQGMALADADNRTDSDDASATLPMPQLLSSSSLSCPSRPQTNMSNLDSFLNSVTPIVPAQTASETSLRDQTSREAVVHPYYCLGDLWETFREWSVYGAGVPLLLYGRHPTIQYYVPFLSGIQLYIDPQRPETRLRRSGEESNAESSRETGGSGGSECKADRWEWDNGVLGGSLDLHNPMNLNRQQLNCLSLRDKFIKNSSGYEAEVLDAPGTLVFEYMEQEQPHCRRPLADTVSALASQFPELCKYRSFDLSPSSWICVAWYPIYRIPMGPTLKDLEASFLTFHSLSTQPGSTSLPLAVLSCTGIQADDFS